MSCSDGDARAVPTVLHDGDRVVVREGGGERFEWLLAWSEGCWEGRGVILSLLFSCSRGTWFEGAGFSAFLPSLEGFSHFLHAISP